MAALINNTIGDRNTATGFHALYSNTGSDNTAIGRSAGACSPLAVAMFVSAKVWVVLVARAVSLASATLDRRRSSTAQALWIGSTGGIGDGILGYPASSRRYKQDIKAMDKASETLFALKPITFRAKGNMDPGQVKDYGLIAEDVAAVDSDLVVYNREGKPETLRFNSINAMLLNEFLKEHRKVEEQGATIAELKKEIATLTATVKDQAALIQKVSAQLEVKKEAPRIVSK